MKKKVLFILFSFPGRISNLDGSEHCWWCWKKADNTFQLIYRNKSCW